MSKYILVLIKQVICMINGLSQAELVCHIYSQNYVTLNIIVL